MSMPVGVHSILSTDTNATHFQSKKPGKKDKVNLWKKFFFRLWPALKPHPTNKKKKKRTEWMSSFTLTQDYHSASVMFCWGVFNRCFTDLRWVRTSGRLSGNCLRKEMNFQSTDEEIKLAQDRTKECIHWRSLNNSADILLSYFWELTLKNSSRIQKNKPNKFNKLILLTIH